MIDLSVCRRAASYTDSALLMFSTGKDSCACMDLAAPHFKRIIPVFLYFVKGISYKERLIAWYSSHYGRDFFQMPRVEDLSRQLSVGTYQRSGAMKLPRVKQWEVDAYLRRRFNVSWIIYGYKRQDSLERRGIINSNCIECDGVDIRNRKIYPLANWSNREVIAYLKQKRLPLPVDYQYGFRDINTFKGPALLWLYRNFPEDYELVKAQYPLIEAALMHAIDHEKEDQL
jgi:phosphoadenosine phosphosulfate reductase